jgi:hypothetical protein
VKKTTKASKAKAKAARRVPTLSPRRNPSGGTGKRPGTFGSRLAANHNEVLLYDRDR